MQGAHQCPLQPVFRLEKPPPDALVFNMAAGAATICNGTIELPAGSFLVCNESCMQLTFQDVTFRGKHLCKLASHTEYSNLLCCAVLENGQMLTCASTQLSSAQLLMSV